MSDVTAGDWIGERLEPGWNIHHFVPRGYEAYARVLHPALRERPVGRDWPADEDADAWERFLADRPEVDAELVSWVEAARAVGTAPGELSPWGGDRADWRAVVGDDGGDVRDAAGWRYQAPAEGRLEPEVLAVVVEHLERATGGGDVFAGVWEGWGGLVGGYGTAPSRHELSWSGEDGPEAARHREALAPTLRDRFNSVFRKPSWQPGILSDEISRGARLQLPDRGHVLFRGRLSAFADPTWIERVPWADGEWTPSPSLIWPEDRSWFLATEVDEDATVIGGSAAVIGALCVEERIEAHPIREGSAL